MKKQQNVYTIRDWRNTNIEEYRNLTEYDRYFIWAYEQLMRGNQKFMKELRGEIVSKEMVKEFNAENYASRTDILNGIPYGDRKLQALLQKTSSSDAISDSINCVKERRRLVGIENSKKSKGIKKGQGKKSFVGLKLEEMKTKKRDDNDDLGKNKLIQLDPEFEVFRNEIYSSRDHKNSIKYTIKVGEKVISLARFILNEKNENKNMTFIDGDNTNFKKSNLVVVGSRKYNNLKQKKSKPIKSKNIRSNIILDNEDEQLRNDIYIKRRKNNNFSCTIKRNKKDIPLARYIMSIMDNNLLITFKNGNTLDFRRSNLLVGDKKTISRYINEK